MSPLRRSELLFLLSCLDALFTLFWVRFDLTTESNTLMAILLDMGNAPFLLTKLVIGALAAGVLYHWFNMPVARRGLTLTLGIYLSVMFMHAAVGLLALGRHALWLN